MKKAMYSCLIANRKRDYDWACFGILSARTSSKILAICEVKWLDMIHPFFAHTGCIHLCWLFIPLVKFGSTTATTSNIKNISNNENNNYGKSNSSKKKKHNLLVTAFKIPKVHRYWVTIVAMNKMKKTYCSDRNMQLIIHSCSVLLY